MADLVPVRSTVGLAGPPPLERGAEVWVDPDDPDIALLIEQRLLERVPAPTTARPTPAGQ